ncbi:MAG: CpsB/CapC family capsule biosynthesis tyrosine phosphatase [Catalinimonas sp.]
MSLLTRLFGPSPAENPPYTTDLHSHLLPGIDDGAADLNESVAMIRRFGELGFTKLITTPHIMPGYYDNDREIILGKRDEVREALAAAGIAVQLEAAAEYYLDEAFLHRLDAGEPLLTFGGNHVLIETSFMVSPTRFEEIVFQLKSAGYQPVLAHPERYLYTGGDFGFAERLIASGLLMQVNLLSLRGYYSPAARRYARGLIDRGWVHMLGSDCHKMRHLEELRKVLKGDRYFNQALALPLLNFAL